MLTNPRQSSSHHRIPVVREVQTAVLLSLRRRRRPHILILRLHPVPVHRPSVRRQTNRYQLTQFAERCLGEIRRCHIQDDAILNKNTQTEARVRVRLANMSQQPQKRGKKREATLTENPPALNPPTFTPSSILISPAKDI